MTVPDVPKTLRFWFVVHFAADFIFAVPLFFFPVKFLTLLGWQSIDPYATRIVAAALFGIGIESFLGRNADRETFLNMLNLKIIWSAATILGLGLSMLQSTVTPSWIYWAVLGVFIAFHLLWLYWRIALKKI